MRATRLYLRATVIRQIFLKTMANNKLTFNYTTFDRQHPAGKNKLSSRALFYQRSLYKEVVYPADATRPLDTWYDKNLFGRVDRSQQTIIARPENITYITHAAAPNMRCLRFVNDAFTDFVEHMQLATLSNCLDPNGNPKIRNPQAFMGYTDPRAAYNSYSNTLINSYVNAFRENPQKPIKSYKEFKPQFIAYLKQVAKMNSVTMTSFLLTKQVSPFSSGLMIGLAKANAGDDAVKYNDWVADPNFDFYVAAAKKYGFLVNKNMPWVLTADLFTDAIQKYISYYMHTQVGTTAPPTMDFGAYMGGGGSSSSLPGIAPGTLWQPEDAQIITPENFFTTYYERCFVYDLENLNDLILDAYLKLVDRRPLYGSEEIIYQPKCHNVFKTKSYLRESLFTRPVLSPKQLLDLYIELKYFEAREPSDVSLSTIKARAYSLYRWATKTSPPGGVFSQTGFLIPPMVYLSALFAEFVYPATYAMVNNSSVDIRTRRDILEIVDTAGELVASMTGIPIGGPTSY